MGPQQPGSAQGIGSYRWSICALLFFVTTSSYIDFLRTKSEIRMLDSTKREEMLGDLREAIDGGGGKFTADYETHLYLAQRSNRD